ncbi:hypothetical protein [Sulfurimonas aquatica]|uniref:hypothetical protein n=1 Tax=Sulfurimonas aquatica TaxID=2672570 RepID=UPI001A9A2184|nr:hypothetical protein [Sulfurimonas aquatica]
MKYLAWLVGILALLVVGIYIVVFTSFGNKLIKPMIENQISKETQLESKLDIFSLSLSDFEILLELNENNKISLKGNYSIFSQSVDVVYSVNLEELKTLKPLTKTQLQSSFHTSGTVIGDMKLIKVSGESDVASSATTYNIELTDFHPTSIITKVANLDLKALLFMLNQKAYARADVSLDLNFKNITPHELDGNILLITKNGELNSDVFKKDFNVSIPKKSLFSMNLDATLLGDEIDYTYLLKSSLAKITSSGNLIPEPLSLDVIYGLDIKELALLKPITGADIRGALKLDGDIKGVKEKLVVNGKTDLASSATQFQAILSDFAPKSVKANVKGLKLQTALYMLNQPHYTDGLFDLSVDIKDANVDNLAGVINSKIYKGVLDSKYLSKAYEFESAMPVTTYNATTTTLLNKKRVNTKVDFNSNLADLDVENALVDLKDNSIQSDYLVNVHDLNKLFFITQRELKGNISANGEFKKAKDLDFSMNSDVAGGKLSANLHNDDFKAKIYSMQTIDILDMLIYPKVFQSSINGDLNYNLAESKGEFVGVVKNGKFTKNEVLDLAKEYAHTDMYKENFKGDIKANINKEKILASLNLKSNRSSIVSQNTKLNSVSKIIDSKIDINANGNPFIVYLSGDVSSPKVNVDANELIKKEATKAIESEAKKFLEKKGTTGLEKEAQKLLKGFF